MIKVTRNMDGSYHVAPQLPDGQLKGREVDAADLLTSIGCAMTALGAHGVGKRVEGVGMRVSSDEWELEDSCLQPQA